MRNIMYSQIEEHRRNVVIKLLKFISIDVNEPNIQNFTKLLSEFNRLDKELSSTTIFNESKKQQDERFDDLTFTY